MRITRKEKKPEEKDLKIILNQINSAKLEIESIQVRKDNLEDSIKQSLDIKEVIKKEIENEKEVFKANQKKANDVLDKIRLKTGEANEIIRNREVEKSKLGKEIVAEAKVKESLSYEIAKDEEVLTSLNKKHIFEIKEAKKVKDECQRNKEKVVSEISVLNDQIAVKHKVLEEKEGAKAVIEKEIENLSTVKTKMGQEADYAENCMNSLTKDKLGLEDEVSKLQKDKHKLDEEVRESEARLERSKLALISTVKREQSVSNRTKELKNLYKNVGLTSPI